MLCHAVFAMPCLPCCVCRAVFAVPCRRFRDMPLPGPMESPQDLSVLDVVRLKASLRQLIKRARGRMKSPRTTGWCVVRASGGDGEGKSAGGRWKRAFAPAWVVADPQTGTLVWYRKAKDVNETNPRKLAKFQKPISLAHYVCVAVDSEREAAALDVPPAEIEKGSRVLQLRSLKPGAMEVRIVTAGKLEQMRWCRGLEAIIAGEDAAVRRDSKRRLRGWIDIAPQQAAAPTPPRSGEFQRYFAVADVIEKKLLLHKVRHLEARDEGERRAACECWPPPPLLEAARGGALRRVTTRARA